MKKGKLSFVGMVRKSDESRRHGSNFGYLKLPNGVDFFSPEIDTNVVLDFIPYLVSSKNHPDRDVNNDPPIAVEGSYWWIRPFKIHRNIGADNKTFVCPTSIGKKCPICEYRDKLLKEGRDYTDEEVKTLQAKERSLFNVIVRSITTTKKGKKVTEPGDLENIMVMDQADYLFQQKMKTDLEAEDAYESFMHPEEGTSVRVRFVENVLGKNKYPAPSRFDFEEREEQFPFEIMDKATDLDKLLNILTYDELKAIFFESVESEDEPEPEEEPDDEPEEKPKKRTSTFNKRKPEPEPDEDEDEPDEDVEEEEEVKQPVKRSKRNVPEKGKAKSTEKECPFEHRFGVDTDRFDDCEDCDLWHDCVAKKKANKK